MASRGFEFAYMVDGGHGSPLIRDWPMAADTAGYKMGDLLVLDTVGRADKAAANAAEAFGVCQETKSTAVTAGDNLKVALVTRAQAWRCSMDATSTAIVKGYAKTVDIVDENTLDADGSSGSLILLDELGTDGDGNVLAVICFNNTTFDGTS